MWPSGLLTKLPACMLLCCGVPLPEMLGLHGSPLLPMLMESGCRGLLLLAAAIGGGHAAACPHTKAAGTKGVACRAAIALSSSGGGGSRGCSGSCHCCRIATIGPG